MNDKITPLPEFWLKVEPEFVRAWTNKFKSIGKGSFASKKKQKAAKKIDEESK